MTSKASTASTVASAEHPLPRRRRRPLLATALLTALTLAPSAASACADPPDIADETTFDPRVLGEASSPGFFYDPYSAGYGEPCGDCAKKEMRADWAGWLGPSISPDEWEAVLLRAPLPDIDRLIFALKGKGAAPAGYTSSSLLRAVGPDKERVVAALYFVGFARRVEAFTSLEGTAGPEAETLQRAGDAALERATDAFLRQRYAFQLLRLRFYRRGWADAVAFHQANATTLAAPSPSLRWRARYYLAGALRRSGARAEANLELARVFASFPPLAEAAAADFHPREEKDWQATLAQAADAKERAGLWVLVGLTRDALAAAQAIIALDPASPWVTLLLVRELGRTESHGESMDALAALAARQAAQGVDRPFVYELIEGHVAALQGKLELARAHLEAARRARPGDAVVGTQAEASLALALARSWTPDSKLEPALEHAALGLNNSPRAMTVRRAVRHLLAERAAAAGRLVDAELLEPHGRYGQWQSEDFIRALIARVSQPATDWDRLAVGVSGYTTGELYHLLGSAQLLKGELAAGAQTLKRVRGARLGTDPFVIHVVDCHDCDHQKYARAGWTAPSVAARLAQLEKTTQTARGDAAAKAALELGNGLYNLTWYGNARVFLEGTPLATRDTRPAETWYRRAYETAVSRELKAQAAFLAAKCELAQGLEARGGPEANGEALPVPGTWFPRLQALEDTKYHEEVLAECGHYERWWQAGRRGRH